MNTHTHTHTRTYFLEKEVEFSSHHGAVGHCTWLATSIEWKLDLAVPSVLASSQTGITSIRETKALPVRECKVLEPFRRTFWTGLVNRKRRNHSG